MIGDEFRADNISPKINEQDAFSPEEGAPYISETRDKPEVDPKAIEDSLMYEDFELETSERIRIQNMSPEETMQYLAQSLNEINAPVEIAQTLFEENDNPSPEPSPLPQPTNAPANNADILNTMQSESSGQSAVLLAAAVNSENDDTKKKYETLTKEPVWGDIYIKASRNLRELCEEGKLTMEQIETELNSRLLEAAQQFSQVTKDKSRIPKVLIPKITELKVAAGNFEPYFQAGEDIAVRAMFFMLYQMLSYADRIAETPETKENLNDFFRRFGAAGIMLSMLDMRV